MKLTRNEIIDRLRTVKQNVYRERDKTQKPMSEYCRGALFGVGFALDLLLRTRTMLGDHKVWPPEFKQQDWINRAIPYLQSELWRISDCLAMPSKPTGLGADWDAELDRKLEDDHKELTELLREVGALEDE